MSKAPVEILLYAPSTSPRLEYVAHVSFSIFCAVPYRIVHSIEAFLQYAGPKINYSRGQITPQGKEIFIPTAGLLEDKGWQAPKPGFAEGLEWPAFFPIAIQGADFSFDLFSMTFYWLSRYEEYQDFQPDRFGRFSASQSLAFQHGVLEYPILDYWHRRLFDLLEQKWPDFTIQRRKYRFLPTYDIDVAWAYLHRPLWRQLLASAREIAKGQFPSFTHRLRVWAGARDPYDVFDHFDEIHRQRQLNPLYFFLMGNYSKYDPSISHKAAALRQLVKKYAGQAGLHPSIASNSIKGRMKQEKSRLESITGIAAKYSRQHYLILRFPETYRRLEAAGFQCDFTMGFADGIGFRAGTGTAFPWYDLQQERQSNLWVQPFQVMDGTLLNYLQLSPRQALAQVEPLIQRCKAVGTTFSTLWHNSSFFEIHGWKGWPEAYTKILDKAKET